MTDLGDRLCRCGCGRRVQRITARGRKPLYIRGHRSLKEFASRGEQLKHKEMLEQVAAWLGCEHCGTLDGPFEWHHRDPSAKSFGIAGASSRTTPELLAELAKCDLTCRPCHYRAHVELRGVANPATLRAAVRYIYHYAPHLLSTQGEAAYHAKEPDSTLNDPHQRLTL